MCEVVRELTRASERVREEGEREAGTGGEEERYLTRWVG